MVICTKFNERELSRMFSIHYYYLFHYMSITENNPAMQRSGVTNNLLPVSDTLRCPKENLKSFQ